MPLSEEEQRILHEIEKSFYEQDPEFADKVKSETVYSHAGRHLKWAIVGSLLGLLFILVTFTSNTALALCGFLLMLVSGVFIPVNIKRLGKAGISDISNAVQQKGLTKPFDKARQGFMQRFHRDN